MSALLRKRDQTKNIESKNAETLDTQIIIPKMEYRKYRKSKIQNIETHVQFF